MRLTEMHQELADLRGEREQLAGEADQLLTRSADTMSEQDSTRFEEIEQRLGDIGEREQRLAMFTRAFTPDGQLRPGHSETIDNTRAGYGSPAVVTRDVNPWADDGRTDAHTRASRAVETLHTRGDLDDGAAERVTGLVAAEGDPARQWLLATGDPAYSRAFTRMLADPQTGFAEFDDAERAAWRRVRTLTRAMGVGSDSAGGFMVPMTLDPAVMLTSDGSLNPLRRLARVVQTTTTSWSGVTSAGSTAEWKAEAASVADASPELAQPAIPVHFGDAYVPFSFEVGGDASSFLPELQRVLLDAADQLMAAAYMNGSGSGQPTGLTTALPAGSKVAAGAADTITAADVVGLQNALGSRFQPRAQWVGNLATINTIGSFETTNGSPRFPEVGSGRLLNRTLNEGSELDAAGDTASAGNDNVLVYGDFAAGMVIVDRVGTTLEIVPHLFDSTTQRPTGQRGALLWFRTGADLVVDNAFRLLTA